jgi:hypothetical protein
MNLLKIRVLGDVTLFNLPWSFESFCETCCFHCQYRVLFTLKIVAEGKIEMLIVIEKLYSATS